MITRILLAALAIRVDRDATGLTVWRNPAGGIGAGFGFETAYVTRCAWPPTAHRVAVGYLRVAFWAPGLTRSACSDCGCAAGDNPEECARCAAGGGT